MKSLLGLAGFRFDRFQKLYVLTKHIGIEDEIVIEQILGDHEASAIILDHRAVLDNGWSKSKRLTLCQKKGDRVFAQHFF